MEQQKKKRGENWSIEEKEILRQLIAESAHIIEDKSTKSSVNMQKIKEWKNILTKFNELMGKSRSDGELKLAWKRMKLSAKSNLSSYRRAQTQTGGGEKPPSPSPEDLEVVAIAPHDFVIEVNDYDSDAVNPVPMPTTATTILSDPKPSPSFEVTAQYEDEPEQQVVCLQDTECTRINSMDSEPVTTVKKRKTSLQNRSDEMRQSIIESNKDFKKRQLEMLEEEHKYNMKLAKLKIKQLEMLEKEHEYNMTIAKLKIKKIELEISTLESKKDSNTD